MSPDELARTVEPLLRSLLAELPAPSALTPIDLLCLITLGVFALDGVRRGLVLGVLDVIALGLTLGAAATLYPLLGTILVESADVPGALANLLAFVLLLAGGQLLYAVGSAILRTLLRGAFAALPPLGAIDGLAGLLPGFVKGAIILAVLGAAIRALPMAAELRRLFDGSVVISRTAPIGAAVVPDLPALLGRLGLDSIVVAPPPQSTTPQPRSVQFPASLSTAVDPASEQRMLELLNRERAAAGLPGLVVDERLRQAARDHSEEMFRRSYFAHESPVHGTPFDRMRRAGARFSFAGENLAYAPNVESAHRGLMNSPDHRKNILMPGFRRVGIGVVSGGSWGRMFTQNFAD